MYGKGVESDTFGGGTDAQHTDTVAADVAALAKGVERVVLSIVPGNHTQAGGTAVHSIKLLI